MEDLDLKLARELQEAFDREVAKTFTSPPSSKAPTSSKSPLSIVDAHWELTDPNPDIRELFLQYNERFFWGKLAGIEVKWSPRMTLCAGLCMYEGFGGLCSVRLSTPLLKLRPRKDLVETLLHEMIHAYLFVTQNNKDHDGHGPEFQKHMNRINKETGTNISIYHNFHDEVDVYRQHWWRCNGPCQKRPPYFGFVKRSMNRPPAPRDPWWGDHQRTCGGTYTKVKEPEGYGQKKGKKDKEASVDAGKSKNTGPDIRSFWGQGKVTGSKPTSVKKPPSSTVTSGQLSSDKDDPHLPSTPPSTGTPGGTIWGDDPQFPSLPSSPGGIGIPGGTIWGDDPDVVGTSSFSDANRQPAPKSDTNPRVSWKPAPNPVAKPTIKTIWDGSTPNETKISSKSHSSGGPRICDINSVDEFENGTRTSNFSGEGCVLGTGRGQGTSFLAQLRREMNSSKKSNTLEKTESQETKFSSPGKSSVDKNKHKVKNKVASPVNTNLKTGSPQKSIKDWMMSGSPKKSPKSLEVSRSPSGKNTSSSSSRNKSPETSPALTKTSLPSGERKGQVIDLSCDDEDDFTSQRKPLFKKVNPASNFTSPPYKRISLYNKDSSNSSSPGDHASGRSSEGTISKRKHEFENDRNSKRSKTFKSWTSKPQYSTSDDSDLEELRPPVKKFKTDSKDKSKSLNIRNPDSVFSKVRHKGDFGGSGDKSVIRNHSSDRVTSESGNSRKDNTHGQYAVDVKSGGEKSSSGADPLQSCPVCQTRVPASQINTHLDQCLSFG